MSAHEPEKQAHTVLGKEKAIPQRVPLQGLGCKVRVSARPSNPLRPSTPAPVLALPTFLRTYVRRHVVFRVCEDWGFGLRVQGLGFKG